MHRVEKKQTARPSEEMIADAAGCVRTELFFMRVGTLRLSQRWSEKQVSPELTAVAVLGILLAGFVAGFVAARLQEPRNPWCLPIVY